MLIQIPSEEEVWNTIKNKNSDSVAGPDGFTTTFFLSPKLDVLDAVIDFFEGSSYPKFFATTNIVLIPKKDIVNNWNNFRPISLCSFFNKLISKIIASRLVDILPRIVSVNQTGFVKGKSIFDNVLLAQEIIHDINAKVNGGNIIFKLDITKAYDNLNWDFLYNVLSFFGFNQAFIKLVKNSIENCYFSGIINGGNHGFFKSSQGLIQGDPLSPALFIIAMDYLSRGLEELYKRHTTLLYHTLGGMPVTHLSFADDFIIFSNGSIRNVKILF
ncbi:putative mitochondrial protein [Dendrobium catenatum]|uniref:Putative mitochondrial protein n=1 Tax=Dendrobium catenatum TaxID=906689 RepID=A0A2I0W9L4_9ASPA|nr:putative mitochondrial protein [Dendrobium catenatum]